jgi:hypothetical protein
MKKALTIGLNKLDSGKYGGFAGWLNEAENEATKFAAIFADYGCQVASLLSKDATINAFERAVSQMFEDDFSVIFFSGHGMEVGQNEAICLYDGYYLDTEFRWLLSKFKADAKVWVVLDCCFAAGMQKALSPKNRIKSLPKGTSTIYRPVHKSLFNDEIKADVKLLCASSEGEFAYEGVWSGALLKTWNKDFETWFERAAKLVTGQTPQLRAL